MSSTPTHAERTRACRRVPAAVIALGLWLPWLVGQLLRDANLVTALMSYIPSPLVAAVCIAFGVRCLRRQQKAPAAALVGVAVMPILSFLALENRWLPPAGHEAGPSACRLVHWNVMHGRLGWERIAGCLDETGAQLAVLSEAPEGAGGDIAARMGPGAEAVSEGRIVIAAAGGLTEEAGARRDGAEAVLTVCNLPSSPPVRVMAVDVASSPFLERKPIVLWVFSLMRQWGPDIVVGDMNTPRDVSVLGNPPGGYLHAYDACGAGLSCTWPVPLPMWAIDQCMIGRRVSPLSHELDSTLLSDHRMQVLDFRLSGESAPVDSGPGSD